MEDTISYDLFNLAAFNYDPLELEPEEDLEEQLLEVATTNAQYLINKIFQLPIEPTEFGPAAKLPTEEVTRLPRAKRIPTPKPETRWEKFAKEKGIKKKKRERMVYDEVTDQFAPRYGYKRAGSSTDEMPILEVKSGSDPYADPWQAERQEKKARVAKNLQNQTNNQLKAAGKPIRRAGKAAFDPSKIPGIPVELNSSESKRGKDGVKRALQLVQHSTASMGRFDEMRPGESERKIRGKKRSFRDNMGPVESDKAAMKASLRQVADAADKRSKGVTNSLAPYEGILPDAPSDSFKARKGKGKSLNSSSGPKTKKRKT